jgi:2-methylisocitrate lyase-like PEP mutase family enzyme
MKAIRVIRPTWKQVLKAHAPLILPAAHDALAARIIERSGFKAYQVGGFALAGSMHAVPDIDLEHFGEKSAMVKKIVNASPLPVLVDADDGYGDAKNVTRTVQEYEAMGVSAIFIEDQVAPKRCGHMGGKEVVKPKDMVDKVKAAVAAKLKPDFFILARTDAIEPHGLHDAQKRAEAFLKAGADGVYLEGPKTKKQLRQIGKNFKGVPLAVSILEGGGKTPWLPPEEFYEMGFNMLLYPTSILFRVAKAIERAVTDLQAHQKMPEDDAVDLERFEEIVDMKHWAAIEEKYA